MLTLIENGQVFAPEPLGRTSVLLAGGRIAKVGSVDRRALEAVGLECTVIDAAGCLVIPGLIDPHQHLLGGSGEEGFSTQTPEIFVSEIVVHGITTVVGVLGVDTTTKTMSGLLAKAKALREQGLDAFVWTGGYDLPAKPIMGTVRDDIIFIEEVIGAGEIAISDVRGMDPPPREIARLATDCYVGGMLSRKAGLVHFHVGEGKGRLAPLRTVLNDFDVQPEWLYATHVERSEALMREAIELAGRGAAVDIDTVEEDLPRWLRFYRDNGGAPGQLTVSTDAAINSPRVLWEQIRACVLEHGWPLEEVLPLVTRDPARILKLRRKGVLEEGRSGDVVVVTRDGLEIVHVLCNGILMVRDGRLVVGEAFLKDTNREIHIVGAKRRGGDPGAA